MYRLSTVIYSTPMESLSYENATPMDVGPPPLRGEVCILGRKYSLPKGTYTHIHMRLWVIASLIESVPNWQKLHFDLLLVVSYSFIQYCM